MAHVTIPGSVTTIGSNAFYQCFGLTTIVIPNSVTNLGDYAFYFCTSLASATLGTGITTIENSEFWFCLQLTNVTILGNVTSIEANAFDYCASLTSFTIPDSVTAIKDYAFLDCHSLSNVAISKNVTRIGANPFASCPSLKGITVDPLNPFYCSLDGVLFNKAQALLVAFPGDKAGGYGFPGAVSSIAEAALCGCTNLTSITLPDTVTNLGPYSFNGCPSLAGIYFEGNAPTYGNFLFGGTPNVIAYYVPGTAGWGSTFSGQPTAVWKPQMLTKDSSFGIRTNQFGFDVTWASGKVVVVEACTNVTSAFWVPVWTNALTGGSGYFSDPDFTKHPGRFYRLRSL